MEVLLGILLMAIGAFAGSSFYAPINKIKNWSWETYWIVQGVVSWVLLPWLFTLYAIPFSELGGVLTAAPASSLGLAIFFGALWGVGGLTWGLSMRYLGISLGQSIASGFCAAFGTVIPPIVAGQNLFTSVEGWLMLGGVAIALAGIAVIGYAGSLREKGMTEEQRAAAVKEFAFKKGLLIAVFAGLMSASMAYGIQAGDPIRVAAEAIGCDPLFSANPVYIFVMFGGFLTNFAYCIYLFAKNRSLKEFALVKGKMRLNNVFFSILGGSLWYMQFLFLGMGKSFIADNPTLIAFSWSILMSLNILFSNFWGIVLKEWKGANSQTIVILAIGLSVLIFSVFFPTLFGI